VNYSSETIELVIDSTTDIREHM